METISIPAPEEIQSRIADCESELRCLRRLLRLSRTAQSAADAKKRRLESNAAIGQGVRHAEN
jgi:hypothetical protein